jgi:hypothetical protein
VSYETFFLFTSGLSKAMRVPKGTLAAAREHVATVTKTLGYKIEKYKDNPAHWRRKEPGDKVTDAEYCRTVDEHNQWVRRLHADLSKWSQTIMKADDSEALTPEDAATFWHGLELLEVPPDRWTKRYYRDRMEHLFEVMRGRPNEGVTFGAKPLNEKQAAAVINLFSVFLDDHDLRLDCPNGHDNLKASYDGGYTWCEKCGPIDEDDVTEQANTCRKRGCPIKAQYADE